MDRVFLDANVLFSAAYRQDAGLRRFWRLPRVQLVSSRYALEEARANLARPEQRQRLEQLAAGVEITPALTPGELPKGIRLPDKDVPILLAAIAAQATHLVTGDLSHFGPLYGKRVQGVLVLTPGEYLRRRAG